mgnify:CR=1 FL=1
MESDARIIIDSDAYFAAAHMFHGREVSSDQEMIAFERASGIQWMQGALGDLNEYQMVFQVVDTKKYMMAKLRYGI